MTSSADYAGDILDLLVKIQHGVGTVEDQNKLGPDVLEKLATTLQYARTNEEFWQTNHDAPKWTAFTMYHAWRNVVLMLDAMKSRIGQAAAGDGGAALDDAANLLPCLLSLAHLLRDTEPARADKEELSGITRSVAQLRRVARRSNMIPSLEQELAGVDREDVQRFLDRLADSVTAKQATLSAAGKR